MRSAYMYRVGVFASLSTSLARVIATKLYEWIPFTPFLNP
jgi:hypothetical protein